MTRPLARAGVLALVLAALAAAAAARAQGAYEASFLNGLAREAYSRGDYDLAFEHFSLLYEVAPSPGALYNMALCAELGGHDDVAFAHFTEYLAVVDEEAARRADAERRMGGLRGRLALLLVESDPPGAMIHVDRIERGDFGSTPRTIAVRPGAHVVLLSHPDYHPARVEVEARVGEEASARLALAPRVGDLRVSGAPAGATVHASRDGRDVASFALDETRSLPVGVYEVRLEAPGHLPAQTVVRVAEGRVEERALAARPIPVPTGRLLVSTGGASARVLVDGVVRGTTPAVLEALPAGTHRVEVRADGFRAWSREVTVVEGRSTHVTVTLVAR